MRWLLAVTLALQAGSASAQLIHLGEVERWLIVLAPMQEALGCIQEDDPLRPSLDVMLQEAHLKAMRAIDGDYEKGVLAGRLAAHEPAAAEEDSRCDRILAALARALLRLQLSR